MNKEQIGNIEKNMLKNKKKIKKKKKMKINLNKILNI